ncbi:NACHT, LRR and PYD domains-containing protein 12-like isoform X3 [Xyrauchen texanus]|uniref:NACHT, LRR and PYD domains-containing protein 12-like isoform X3 n=1 Tax=Xyrauchen texanus TaxID=154827 RepID=UPI0022429D39|nr:NACHT, LRR and PYD domains-containing protein 12-like isoform X3 [Xyrauchen texanus]
MDSTKDLSGQTYTGKVKSVIHGESPESSCVSMKSDRSMEEPLKFSSGAPCADVSVIHGESPEPSCVSMKSDGSMYRPITFSSGESLINYRNKQDESESTAGKVPLDSIFEELEHKIISLMKKELKSFKRLLISDSPACSEREEEDDEGQSRVREGFLKITLHVLKKMKQTDLANTLQTKLISVHQQKLKTKLKEKFQRITEGMSNQSSSTLVNEIYTELYITEGGSAEINNEHEVRQIETASRRAETQETPIKCNDIFKALPGQHKAIRTVLTKGVAGIGKTVSVQKFIVDWTEGKANQDVHFIFPLPFRELNLMKHKNISLMDLLHQFFTDTKELRELKTFLDDYKVIFIFDGLDECRLPLDFQNNDILWDVTESASVDVLLTNLIKGNLLPSALLWITSRPAAANQIPPECVDQLTDVRGFNDPQKDEYFRKRIKDERLANRIITHMKSSRSLYIMCHIPVFCWISATVLQRLLSEAESAEIPKTLTQMFTHFLIFQSKLKSQKYDGKCEVDLQQARKRILSLGKLAFQQLEKGNLIFYEEDLRECGIDVREASVYSGVCTQIFREEFGLHLGKVFSFVHLSIQEFLAALYAFISFSKQTSGLFSMFRSSMSDLLKSEVDKALQSENGHLDLFIRFLLGLSLMSNQTILRDLLTQTGSSSDSKQEIVEYIKMKIRENPSPEKSINLFHCLNELNDHSLVQEVQTYVNRRDINRLSGVSLSPAQWSALVFVLLNSEEELDQFNLRKYDSSHECLLRLLPVIKASRKADLMGCDLTEQSCSALASVLSSNSSSLRELDLSNNDLQDSGVKLLSDALKSPHCTVEILRFAACRFTYQCCESLSSVLQSSKSLRQLDLSNNDLQDSGVKLLSDALNSPHCILETLIFADCRFTDQCCESLSSVLQSSKSLRELDLSNNELQDSGVKLLSDALKSPHCILEILIFAACRFTGQCCESLSSVLQSSKSLRELDLSNNDLQDSGVKLLSDALKSPHCTLEILRFAACRFTYQCCESLSSVLQSSKSLRELDLSNNDLQDSGVKLLSDALKSPHCILEILRLSGCMMTEEGCCSVASALRSNLSRLKELDLSYNHPGESGVKLVSERLNDPNCTLDKLNVDDGGEFRITAGPRKYVCDLTLDSNTAHTELILSEGNRKVTHVEERQSYPDHPERFDVYHQVLCRESLTGRCYWETQWSGDVAVISVSYKEISRKGESYDCAFGFNVNSWSLYCSNNRFTVCHNNNSSVIRPPSHDCKRVGVYVDCPAGTLSFYSVSDTHTLTHLHTLITTFTRPLYAGFRVVYPDSSVCVCEIDHQRHTHTTG